LKTGDYILKQFIESDISSVGDNFEIEIGKVGDRIVYPSLFQDNFYEAALGSPYLLLPRYVDIELASENLTISDIVYLLIYPHDQKINRYFESKLGKVYLSYIRFVLSDFMTKYVDNKHSDFKIPRHFPKAVKELIKAESNLSGEVWRTIKLLSPYFSRPLPLIFFNIFKEVDLFFFSFKEETEDPTTKITTVTSLIKNIQSQNKRLITFDPFDNPFDINKSPSTHNFVNICHFELNKNDDFRKQYNALIAARKSLTTRIIASHPEIRRLEDSKKERRGRKY